MKKQNKYNLLAKDEPKKQKDAHDWIQMEPVSKWQTETMKGSDFPYIKLQDQYSQIQNHNRSFKIHNLNPNHAPNSLQKSPLPANTKNCSNSNSTIMNQKNIKQSVNQGKGISSVILKNQKGRQRFQSNPTSNQSYQIPINPYSFNQGLNSLSRSRQLAGNSSYSQKNVSVYSVYNPSQYSQCGPQYYSNQNVFQPRQSQANFSPQYQSQISYYQHPQTFNPINSTFRQQSCQSLLSQNTTSKSNQEPQPLNKQTMRSTFRRSIPQMTVNCDKCTFTQLVPSNSRMFICCMCNEITECFPLYGVFVCGICSAKVVYPYGTSTLIKCTKCLSVNRVNPEPTKKDQQNLVFGLQKQEQSRIHQQKQFQEIPNKQMKSRGPQIRQFLTQNTNQNVKQSFKALSEQKKLQRGLKRQDQMRNFEQELKKEQYGYSNGPNRSFNQELVDLDSRLKDSENLHKQIMELSEKLDESLIVSKNYDENHRISLESNKLLSRQKPKDNLAHQEMSSYPSLFD